MECHKLRDYQSGHDRVFKQHTLVDSKPYYVLVVLGKASNYVKVSIGPELDLKSHGTEENFPDDFFTF